MKQESFKFQTVQRSRSSGWSHNPLDTNNIFTSKNNSPLRKDSPSSSVYPFKAKQNFDESSKGGEVLQGSHSYDAFIQANSYNPLDTNNIFSSQNPEKDHPS